MRRTTDDPLHSHSTGIPRRSIPGRSRAATLLLAVLLALGLASEALGDDAQTTPSEAPLVLTNEHVGMSAAQVEAVPAANEAAAPPPASAEITRLQAEADALAEIAAAKAATADQLAAQAEAASRALAAIDAGLIPGVGPNEDGPASYERCMEVTIRRGDSLRSSDALCRFVFPNTPK